MLRGLLLIGYELLFLDGLADYQHQYREVSVQRLMIEVRNL